ncbi:MAG: UbiA family prenyltransferase [Nitrososphaerota archaeon]|nr:UbiA family prenyltransferase [Nitrososphaerota archaeon]
MTQSRVFGKITSVFRLRAWKLAIAGPSVYWYFPIFFVLLSTSLNVNLWGISGLFIAMMVSAAWGFILNDLMDREADAKSGRADSIHGHSLGRRSMEILIISTALFSWVIVFLIGGGIIFKLVLAINYLFGALYSIPPIKFKVRKFWGFFANSVMERPLPILVFLTYMNYYTVWTIILPTVMELSWSVFKHQAADVKEDTRAKVSTLAVQLGEKLSMKIVNSFLNPVSFASLLFLIGLSWFYVPTLRLLLSICFFVVLLGGIALYVAERLGYAKTYVTPTDPPYIMYLNLAYRFFVLPILAYGMLIMHLERYPLILLLAITLGYHGYAYSNIIRKIS